MLRNVQPLFADFAFGGLAVAHNGNLTNAMLLRRRLVEEGSLFQSTSDTEVIIHLIARSQRQSIVERVVEALCEVEGAWSLVGLFDDGILGGRDPLGVRPLVLGQLDGAWILASETCALDILGAEFVRDVEPGEIVRHRPRRACAACTRSPPSRGASAFSNMSTSRGPTASSRAWASTTSGSGSAPSSRARAASRPTWSCRCPTAACRPRSATPRSSAWRFELGIIRNHYVGRTFIEPADHIRNLGVKLKHNANRVTLAGKRVVLVDDSIVRGTTSTKIVGMVRAAGASEVHMRIASPPTTHSCFYGVDTPERSQAAGGATTRSRRWRDSSASTASPSSRSTASTGRWARRAATGRSRNTAMPASPATIRPGSPTSTANSAAAAQPAAGGGVSMAEGARRPHRPRHRRVARPGCRGRQGVRGARVRSSSWLPGPAARSRRSTTPAVRRVRSRQPWPRSTSPTASWSTRSAASLFQRFGRLDGLVACAGELGIVTPVEPSRAQAAGADPGAEPRRQSPADPQPRPAPAGGAGRPGGVRDRWRRRLGAPLLGWLRRDQGGAGGDGPGLRGRAAAHAGPGQPARSRPDGDPPARAGLSRRAPG